MIGSSSRSPEYIQGRLLTLAAVFLLLYALSTSLAPAVRLGSWTGDINWSVWTALASWAAVFALAHRETNRRSPERDPYLLPAAALLSGWGLLEVARLAPNFGLRQSIWLVFSMALVIIGLRLPPGLHYLRRYKYAWLTSGLILAALTLIFGTNPLGYGPRLWLGCCGIYLQPSEPLKLLLVIYLSAYLADRQYVLPGKASHQTSNLTPLLAPTVVMTGLALAIMLVQRDLGAATLLLFIYTMMVYLSLGDVRIPFIGIAGITLAGVVGYALFDVVRVRIDAWLNPWLDPSGRSFQIVQSLMAVANGGVFGRGPGLGSPGLVPIVQSDFIFAAIAEETGLAGVIGVFLLLGLLAQRGLRLAITAPGTFRRLLSAGICTQLVGQAILIIGGNLRLLPLTGVTLPFVSYGGSSLLFSCLALLLLLKLSAEKQEMTLPTLQPRVTFQLGGLLAAGLAAAAVLSGWWAIYRGPALLERSDNARRSISDRFVPRGSIRDRQNRLIMATSGKPGNYSRQSFYAPLGPVTGYTHPIYGQAGLEAALDDYLRGLAGYPDSYIAWRQLAYGQPPSGLDVHLTIDLEYQAYLDTALSGSLGAAVLLNAHTGEILAMASHPGFDPDQLDQTWSALLVDQQAPLLNRALQGLYPPGAALAPLLLAAASNQNIASVAPEPVTLRYGTWALECARPGPHQGWSDLIIAGCPNAAARLGEVLGSQALLSLFTQAGLYTLPQIGLPAASSAPPTGIFDAPRAALGLEGQAQQALRISPLQLALALAPLSNGGVQPDPHLTLGYQDPQGNWQVLLGNEHGRSISPATSAASTAEALADPTLPVWHSLAQLPGDPGNKAPGITWFVAGTLPTWQAAPLTLVILLEEDNPERGFQAGMKILEQVLQIAP